MEQKNDLRKVNEITKDLINKKDAKKDSPKKEKFDSKIIDAIKKIDKKELTEKSISNKSIYKEESLKKYGKTFKRARAVLRRKIYELSKSLVINYELKTKLADSQKKELKTLYCEILKNTDVFMNERKNKEQEKILKLAHCICFEKQFKG